MPELPDVETFRRYLDATSLHQTIQGVEIRDTRILGQAAEETLRRALQGTSLDQSDRHGKYLLVQLVNGSWLIFHFGMTGYLQYFKKAHRFPSHCRFLLNFDNGFHLAYDCQRLLGKIDLTDNWPQYLEHQGLGPDALDAELGPTDFAERLSNTGKPVKSALMDQKLIAGIGNVYSDEILFQARIHPATRSNRLSPAQASRLFRFMRSVLQQAIQAHADPERLPGGYLLARRRTEQPCPVCGGEIRTEKIGGRSAYFCPRCQRASTH